MNNYDLRFAADEAPQEAVTVCLVDNGSRAWAISEEDPNGIEISVRKGDVVEAMVNALLGMYGYTPEQYFAEHFRPDSRDTGKEVRQ